MTAVDAGGAFAAKMAGHSDAELFDIVASEEGIYRPEALEAARRELVKRNLTPPSKPEVAVARKAAADARAIESLESGWVVAAVLAPPFFYVPWLLMASRLERQGYAAKARTLRRIVWAWIAAYAVMAAIAVLTTCGGR